MRRRLLMGALLLPLAIGATALPAAADVDCAVNPALPVCTVADDGSFDVTATSTAAPVGYGSAPGLPVTQTGTYVGRSYAPACPGNTQSDPGLICVAARDRCTARPGTYAYWVWTATFDRASGRQLSPWTQQLDPLTVCKGPTDPGVPRGPAIAALLARDFQRLVVRRGVVVAHPAGRTLVNLDTALTTATTDYDLPVLTLLGSRVQVRARAERYDWVFGDGATSRAGLDTVHRYLQPGPVGVSVRITWSGTYTVDGGPTLTVNGTAVTTGPPTPLRVSEAHAERVTR